MERVLISGGAGFIGSHVVEHLLKNTDWEIVIMDKLTYASEGFDRLKDIKCFDDKRVQLLTYDFAYKVPIGMYRELKDITYVFHMGAETHVDRSIDNPEPFVRANVVGTMHMLNLARIFDNLKLMLYFSTDEIFGSAPAGVNFKEWDRYNSMNPYAATTAAGEELALAYANSYKLPVFITHTMNCFGERQHHEKFIPMTIRKVLNKEPVFIHADKTRTISGTRYWIHCRNVADAILFLINKAVPREKYNIVGEKEVSNLDLAKLIARILNKPLDYEMVDFHSSRPGHDLRYALDGTKLKEMGWECPIHFESSLEKTINWYFQEDNKKWLG